MDSSPRRDDEIPPPQYIRKQTTQEYMAIYRSGKTTGLGELAMRALQPRESEPPAVAPGREKTLQMIDLTEKSHALDWQLYEKDQALHRAQNHICELRKLPLRAGELQPPTFHMGKLEIDPRSVLANVRAIANSLYPWQWDDPRYNFFPGQHLMELETQVAKLSSELAEKDRALQQAQDQISELEEQLPRQADRQVKGKSPAYLDNDAYWAKMFGSRGEEHITNETSNPRPAKKSKTSM